MFSWFCFFIKSLYSSISFFDLLLKFFNFSFFFILTIIPLVFPSSLITKFLNTGLLTISSNPLLLSTSSSLSVLKFLSLSCSGASELFNRGTSNKVITLWTQFKLCILYFKLKRLLIETSETIPSFGVYVKMRNSLEPYFCEISWRYLRSGSPSINKVSEEASSLKFLE